MRLLLLRVLNQHPRLFLLGPAVVSVSAAHQGNSERDHLLELNFHPGGLNGISRSNRGAWCSTNISLKTKELACLHEKRVWR